MMITVHFGAEHAVFGEGKLPLLDLGMDKEGFLIFPCYEFGRVPKSTLESISLVAGPWLDLTGSRVN
ncbi:hypothetical protein TIFTF001_054683 [Ficus carica]|uniref:Uncharacterized protein n=1 Tax=Ficus carica TaxID=3494 RepID=A0AA88JH49_FICCA|nr:hypothetical protein TIFTF001_054683 [Ficus carica]